MTLPDFDPAFPVPAIASAAGAAALFTLYRAFAGRPTRPAWVQGPAVLLRLAVIALLAFILMNPVKRVTRQTPESGSMILLDRSASMKLATGDAKTRWTDAKAWVAEARAAIEANGQAVPPVAVFNEELRNVTDLETIAPDGNETHLASAVGGLLERGDEAPRQIIVVSDGRAHDRGELPKALAAARDLGARISTKLVGTDTPPRNAWIEAVQAPRSVRPKAKVNVHVDLASTGISPDEAMALILREEGGKEVARADFRPQQGDGTTERVLTFEIGLRTTKYSLELVPAADEVAAADNRFGFTIEVTSSKLRVLFVEGTHGRHTVGLTGHWWNDMEFMTRAWDATGEIDYECLTPVSQYTDSPNLVGVTFENGEMRLDPSKSFPATREDLHRFDVLLVSDVPVGNFSGEQMRWVVDWVIERGGGFLMGGGNTSFDTGNYDQTPWERITPVDMLAYGAGFMRKEFPIRIPDSVRSHPLWKVAEDPEENEKILGTHPVFFGMNRIKRAKPGAIVLAVRADAEGDEPVIAAQSYGRGRSVAWLPDPNGGWGERYITWGPEGGPPVGPLMELGHGRDLVFNEHAAKSATGPTPSHPSPYYGQYWVNLVKWLGENSIRRHRDQLAGRAKAAAAKPGEMLPVAAEVLAVTKPGDLLGLDVGARLDIPGTPRVRLEYNRDAREFVGEVPVPAGAEGEQVTVFFDASANGTGFTDAVPVGLRRSHLEFTETSPDAAFMKELSEAAAGRVLDTPQDAATWLKEVAEERRKQADVAWNQPLWPRWPLLGAIIGLLCLEWALRRRSMMPLVATLAFFLTPDLSQAQESKDIAALIEQLGAPKVRLRDEAEDQLHRMPEALPAVKEAAASSPSAEIRLRATGLLGSIAQSRWIQNVALSGHTAMTNSQLWAMVVDAQGEKLYTRSQDCVRQWDIKTLEAGLKLGGELIRSTDWTSHCPMVALAVSPDGKTLISTDNGGSLVLDNTETGEREQVVTTSTPQVQTVTTPDGSTHTIRTFDIKPLVHVGYAPDQRRLMTSCIDFNVKFWSLPDLKELPSSFKLPHIGHAFAFAPDEKHLVISLDKSGEPDFIHVRDLETGINTCEVTIPDRANTLRLSKDGSRLLASNRNGSASLWTLREGVLGDETIFMRAAKSTNCAIFSPDEKSVFVASDDPDRCVGEWDIATGEALWVHPRSSFGVHTIAFLPDGRLAGTCSDLKLRIWSRAATGE